VSTDLWRETPIILKIYAPSAATDVRKPDRRVVARSLRVAGDANRTINALAIEAFNDLLKKYGKRQSVENPLLD
jgi:hypothetical protein